MKILIVDDEKLIRDVIREYCYNEGFETVEAENGVEALNILELHSYKYGVISKKNKGTTFYFEIKRKL